MTKKRKVPAESMKFEAALEKLDKIVEEMESGDLPLEQILAKYEEGNGLVRYCAKKLGEAEKRIEILMKNKEGGLAAHPLDENDETGRNDGDVVGQDKDEQLF